jgi:hypothetical protein
MHLQAAPAGHAGGMVPGPIGSPGGSFDSLSEHTGGKQVAHHHGDDADVDDDARLLQAMDQHSSVQGTLSSILNHAAATEDGIVENQK